MARRDGRRSGLAFAATSFDRSSAVRLKGSIGDSPRVPIIRVFAWVVGLLLWLTALVVAVVGLIALLENRYVSGLLIFGLAAALIAVGAFLIARLG